MNCWPGKPRWAGGRRRWEDSFTEDQAEEDQNRRREPRVSIAKIPAFGGSCLREGGQIASFHL
jgi:hypothetical protein